MDQNVTLKAMKNLVLDNPAPLTVALLGTGKSDADGLFKLMDANVTRGNLKNLVTDKPAPLTVALAQKSDADGLFKLMDANVTRGNLKNLVTDKPAPITVALAQTHGAPETPQAPCKSCDNCFGRPDCLKTCRLCCDCVGGVDRNPSNYKPL
jgi:hypothetical protein